MFEEDQSTIIYAIIAGILIMGPLFYWLFKKQRELNHERREKYENLTSTLSSILIKGKIRNIQDFIDFVIGYEHSDNLRLRYPYSYPLILTSVKHKILKNQNEYDVPKSLEKLDDLQTELNKIIKESELKNPFSDVPTEERNLLLDILEMSNQKENDLFTKKLHKLSGNIVRRETDLKESSDKNTKALKLTKYSIWLAIIFFVISTGLAFYYN